MPTSSGPSDLPILGFDELGPDEPRTVLITGAAGNLGRKLRAAWRDRYDLVLIDRHADPDEPDLIVADLSEWDDYWVEYFDEVDTVVHLAANPDEFAAWSELVGPNLDALANVMLAAAQAGVDRLVFASSNHVMGGYRGPGQTGPISVALPPKPGNAYGASKLMGERLGRAIASLFGVTVIALRIGWAQPGANRPETLDPARGDPSIWLSNEDLIRLFTRAIEADTGDQPFVVANGLSRNAGTRWTLHEAAEALGFEPVDGLDGTG